MLASLLLLSFLLLQAPLPLLASLLLQASILSQNVARVLAVAGEPFVAGISLFLLEIFILAYENLRKARVKTLVCKNRNRDINYKRVKVPRI